MKKYKTFELRCFSRDPRATGETDFKGPTEVFNTEQRIEYLRHYADYATRFFNDPGLDLPVVTDEEVAFALTRIKPQPLPNRRRRVLLEHWRALGFKAGQDEASKKRLTDWNEQPGVEAGCGELLVATEAVSLERTLAQQTWRFRFAWRFRPAPGGSSRTFRFAGKSNKQLAATVQVNQDGRVFSTSLGIEHDTGIRVSADWHELAIEVDLAEHRYNLFIDRKLALDFAPLEDPAVSMVQSFRFDLSKGDRLAAMRGTGFFPMPAASDETPFAIVTFMDEDFRIKPSIEGWAEPGYDDRPWQTVRLPHPHGGERCAGEDLFLRHRVEVGSFDKAVLHIETIDPGGEVWVNGEPVAEIENREPVALDIGRLLKPGGENVVALRVNAYAIAGKERGKHAPTDPNIGWFAGRAWLDLQSLTSVQGVFAYTLSHGDPAVLQTRLELNNDTEHLFCGRLKFILTPWFPEENEEDAVSSSVSVELKPQTVTPVEHILEVPSPRLWTWKKPFLYKLRVCLLDGEGHKIDDDVITTGIRTVGQDGGVFRINGNPELLRAPLFFGERPPIEDIARYQRCGPAEWIVRELLMVRKMNGNGGRMSVHHANVLGINDPRFAEYADQLGFMWIWAPTPWVRQGSVWDSDWSGLDQYVKQVRNHPSIVMWQTSNHPDFKGCFADLIPFYKLIHNTIYPLDPSRLISPTADYRRIGPIPSDDGCTDADGVPVATDPVWTAPMITRGSMDTPTGYGRDWSVLRLWPRPRAWMGGVFQPGFLASRERAYFNFEHEETIGMPNWDTCKGKPYYRLYSYERYSDVIGKDDMGGGKTTGGNLGRYLALDEWRESQAWQAFSAYEAIRKMRRLGYDGFCWCCLHGGGNNATYMKPVIDYHGNAKLAFYTNRMAFQEVLAGSGNVDMVYGSGDEVPVTVLNLGPERRVDVRLAVCQLDGTVLVEKVWRDILLPHGRTEAHLPGYKPEIPGEGYFAFEYTVEEHMADSGRTGANMQRKSTR